MQAAVPREWCDINLYTQCTEKGKIEHAAAAAAAIAGVVTAIQTLASNDKLFSYSFEHETPAAATSAAPPYLHQPLPRNLIFVFFRRGILRRAIGRISTGISQRWEKSSIFFFFPLFPIPVLAVPPHSMPTFIHSNQSNPSCSANF